MTPNCTPESLLHFTFIRLLADKLDKHIKQQIKFDFKWDCKFCLKSHTGNLIKKSKKVQIEYSLPECRPDIALFDENNNVFAVIEIVVTHKPEEKTLKFYKDNNIILIQIELKSDKDIDELDKKISNPDKVTVCLNPVCKKCGKHKMTREMITYTTPCKQCRHLNKVVYITKLNEKMDEDFCGIWEFSKDEIKLAKSKGINIKWNKSQRDKWYLTNNCNNCNQPIIEQQYNCFWCMPFPPVDFSYVEEKEYYTSIELNTLDYSLIGFYCIECNKNNSKFD